MKKSTRAAEVAPCCTEFKQAAVEAVTAAPLAKLAQAQGLAGLPPIPLLATAGDVSPRTLKSQFRVLW